MSRTSQPNVSRAPSERGENIDKTQVGTRNDLGVPDHSEVMKTPRIPREQNPYFLTGRGKRKVWFPFWTNARKNGR
jgi:hypothetical protein